MRRKMVPPNHRLPFYNEDPIQSHELYNIFPPKIEGIWGSTPDGLKKKFLRRDQMTRAIPTAFDKSCELYHLEENLWFHRLDLPLDVLESLDFATHLSRTCLRKDSELALSDQPLPLGVVRRLECFLQTETRLNRPHQDRLDVSAAGQRRRCADRRAFLCSLMECLHSCLVEGCPPHSHLLAQHNQLDEGAGIETYFKRAGYAEMLRATAADRTLAENIWAPIDETVLDADGLIRFRLRTELAWQLRGRNPLKPFVSHHDATCYEGHLPSALYRPELFDIQVAEFYDFTNLPLVNTSTGTPFARNIAGYWSRTPFWEGDPCEFGLVGVVDTARSEKVRHDLSCSSLLTEAEKSNLIMRHGLAEGILTAFAWTSALAYNQGFTLYNEITYPFAVQVLLMDDRFVQLLRFQLNSITSLWKADDAPLPYNLAWYSERLPLYETHQSEATFSVNPAALRLITNALLCEPSHSSQLVDLRPHLNDGLSPRSLSTPEHRLVVPSASVNRLFKEDDEEGGGSLTEGEKSAIIAMDGPKIKRCTRRLYSHPKPHPNDIFFFRLTKKSDILKDLRESMPALGGRFSNLPAPYDKALREVLLYKRDRMPQRKVLRPPRRWR